jgi:hypothetical protein
MKTLELTHMFETHHILMKYDGDFSPHWSSFFYNDPSCLQNTPLLLHVLYYHLPSQAVFHTVLEYYAHFAADKLRCVKLILDWITIWKTNTESDKSLLSKHKNRQEFVWKHIIISHQHVTMQKNF